MSGCLSLSGYLSVCLAFSILSICLSVSLYLSLSVSVRFSVSPFLSLFSLSLVITVASIVSFDYY